MTSCKEYLEKQPDGTYSLVLRGDACKGDDIEVPEGAECLTKCKDHNGDEWLLFWKGDYKFCVGHDKEWFYFESGVSEYLNDWCGLAKVIWQRAMVKPLKEYLDKKPDGSYELIVSNGGCVDRDWIEIPEGAERARIYNGELRFFSGQYTQVDVGGDHFGAVVWQREQDEPFLTPETTLNDQYAEIQKGAASVKAGWNSIDMQRIENVAKAAKAIADSWPSIGSGAKDNTEIHGTVKAEPDFNFGTAEASGGTKPRENNHYFINVSDVDEVDFYEIAKRYNVTDPAVQHILKKCLAIGNRGHKDLETDLKDILKTAKRALQINGFGE